MNLNNNNSKFKNVFIPRVAEFIYIEGDNNIQGKRCWFIVKHIEQKSLKGCSGVSEINKK